MGRYANLSTEYEYKFVFGVQDSTDIEQFFGKDTSEEETCENVGCEDEDCDGDHGENLSRVWDNKNYDKEKVLARLTLMKEKDKTLPLVDLSQYEKNIEGTDKLNEWFFTNYLKPLYNKQEEEGKKQQEEDKKNGVDIKTFSYIVKRINEPSESQIKLRNMCLYCLGYIIHHQLTYVDQLSVMYEY